MKRAHDVNNFVQLMGQLHQLVCDLSEDTRYAPHVRADIRRKAHEAADAIYNDFADMFA